MKKKQQQSMSSSSPATGEAPEWFERNIAEFKEEMLVIVIVTIHLKTL